jgi:hypothetical protein
MKIGYAGEGQQQFTRPTDRFVQYIMLHDSLLGNKRYI